MKKYVLIFTLFLLLVQSKLVFSDTLCHTIVIDVCCDGLSGYCFPLSCCVGGQPFNRGNPMCDFCSTPPIITIQSPQNITYEPSSIWANVTLDKEGSWCGRSLDNDVNVTMTNSSGNWNNLMTSINNDNHNVTFCCNDTYDNMNCSAIEYFTVGCNGAVELNCSVPPVEKPGDVRNWSDNNCGRTNAKIDCDGNYNSHTVCNVTNLCSHIEPTINTYSVSKTSIILGETFSTNVNGFCPSSLPGKCLVECRVVHPDGHYIELDSWSENGVATLPPVKCDQTGNYIVDYCVAKTDFYKNRGWGGLNDTNTTINCKPLPQCSDGTDNNGNGLIDANDPGCHNDGNPSNPASYDSNDNTECSEKLTSCSKSENCCSGLFCGFGNVCRVSDSNPPTYSFDNDNSGGSATAGTIVNITVLWSDDSGLSNAIFRYNLTGVWSNASTCYLSGTSGWCNQTIDTTGISGTVCWNQWANDTSNNWNNTMLSHCFNVITETSSSQNETPFSPIESILESLRGEISSSTSEFSMKFLNLTFQFFGIVILSMLLIIVIEELVKSH